jgi:hypothetical protein
MIAHEQAAGRNRPGDLRLEFENSQVAAGSPLQPQGPCGHRGFFGTERAADQKIKQRDDNFAGKPKQPPQNAEWMLAQSFHAQVSNAMTVAVNQENERSPISVSGQLRSARVNSEKASPANSLFLKAVFVFDRCGCRRL